MNRTKQKRKRERTLTSEFYAWIVLILFHRDKNGIHINSGFRFQKKFNAAAAAADKAFICHCWSSHHYLTDWLNAMKKLIFYSKNFFPPWMMYGSFFILTTRVIACFFLPQKKRHAPGVRTNSNQKKKSNFCIFFFNLQST